MSKDHVLEVREGYGGDGVRFIRIDPLDGAAFIELEIMHDTFCVSPITFTDEQRRALIAFLLSVDAAATRARAEDAT